MKPVIQLERTGCGIASVAALVGEGYSATQQVANQMGIYATDRRLWSKTTHVRRLLKHYRLHASSRPLPFASWNALPDRVLLAIKWHRVKERDFWHWVVFVRDSSVAYVLDLRKTLKHHVRKDFWRMKPRWFIEIQ